MSFEALLRETVSLERAQVSAAPTGVHVRNWTVVATAVRAEIQQLGGGPTERDWGRADRTTAVGFFAAGVGLSAGDRVVRADGSRWEAKVVEDVRGHHLEADLRRVEPV